MESLTAFQRDILYVVSGLDNPNGIEIKNELEKYYDSEVNHGRLYPNLDDLTEEEFLQKGMRNRRANEYMMTDQGRRALRAREKWEYQYVQIDASEVVSLTD